MPESILSIDNCLLKFMLLQFNPNMMRNKFLSKSVKFQMIFLILLISMSGYARKFYVSTNGSNNNDGTELSPWKDIAFACNYSKFVLGDTISIGVGTFIETEVCQIPCGINLIGSGTGNTIIKSSKSPVLFLENCQNPSNRQHIAGFSLDGQNKLAGEVGLEVRKVYGIFIHDIVVENFKGNGNGGGINLSYADNCNVYNCTLKNNAGESINECGGNLGVGELNNCNFYNLLIQSDNAYGIKTSITAGNVIKNTKFFNIHIEVSPNSCSRWNNIAFELYGIHCQNVKIFNCYMNNVLSLSPFSVHTISNKSVEIYNNHFQIPNSINAYAIEATVDNLNIHNNYFEGGLYPIASWENSPILNNILIHHNVFDNQNGPTGIIHMPGGVTNSSFYNNTVVLRTPIRCFNLKNGSDVDFKNNLFVSAVGNLGDSLGLTANSNFMRNQFYNINPRGTQTITSNPLLSLSGIFPNKYIPSIGSSAINSGMVISGINDDSIDAPDLGAFEVGRTAWNVGITSATPVIARAFADKLSGLAPLSINFDGSESKGDNLVYQWELGNGMTQNGSAITYTYTTSGNYNVSLIVTASNRSDTIGLTVRVFDDSQLTNMKLEAEQYDDMSGVNKELQVIGSCDNLDWICFNNVNLSTGFNKISIKAAVVSANQKVEVRLDSPTGQLLDEFTLQQTGSWNIYMVNTYNMSVGRGIQNLYFVFKGGFGVGNFDWIEFSVPKYQLDTVLLEAENFDRNRGVINNQTFIGSCDNQDWVCFDDVNFSNGFNMFSIRAAVFNSNQKLELRLNSPIGELVDELDLVQTGSWEIFNVNSYTIPNITGSQSVFFVFKGGFGVGDFDWFSFSKSFSEVKETVNQIDNIDVLGVINIYKCSPNSSEFYVETDNLTNTKFTLTDLQGRPIRYKTKFINAGKLILSPELKHMKGVLVLKTDNNSYVQVNKLIIN